MRSDDDSSPDSNIPHVLGSLLRLLSLCCRRFSILIVLTVSTRTPSRSSVALSAFKSKEVAPITHTPYTNRCWINKQLFAESHYTPRTYGFKEPLTIVYTPFTGDRSPCCTCFVTSYTYYFI